MTRWQSHIGGRGSGILTNLHPPPPANTHTWDCKKKKNKDSCFGGIAPRNAVNFTKGTETLLESIYLVFAGIMNGHTRETILPRFEFMWIVEVVGERDVLLQYFLTKATAGTSEEKNDPLRGKWYIVAKHTNSVKKAGKGYTRVDKIYISVSRMGFAAEKHFSIYQKKPHTNRIFGTDKLHIIESVVLLGT